MTECEEYAIIDGCDIYCPVYQRGECHNEDTRDYLYLRNKQIYIGTREKAVAIQKRAFELGWRWSDNNTNLRYDTLIGEYLLFWDDMILGISPKENKCLETIKDIYPSITENRTILQSSSIVENSIKTLKDKLNKIWEK